MRIGIVSGTFNPIHYGHLRLAEDAVDEVGLERVIFVPTGISPHKINQISTPVKLRYTMVSLAIKYNPKFDIDEFEADESVHYTCDTIYYFKDKFPNDGPFFIIGSDSLSNLHSWKEGYELLNLCQFIVGVRQGAGLNLPQEIIKKVIILNSAMLNISAREIRNTLEKNKSVKYLLPDEVIEYIGKHKLYKR